MFKTQLSFPLLFKSNVIIVRRAAVRALHTLLLARNMTSVVRAKRFPLHCIFYNSGLRFKVALTLLCQIPNFVPRHCAMIKDVLFDDQDVGLFYEVCRLFAELLPELSDQTVSALDTYALSFVTSRW